MISWTERYRIRFEPRAKNFGDAVVSRGSHLSTHLAVILRLDRRIQYPEHLRLKMSALEYWVTRLRG
jgi:hypothetical protein